MDETPVNDTTLGFDEFPLPDYDEWQTAAVDSLGGKPLDKLTTPTYEGIPLRPLYRREDMAGLAFAGTIPGRAPFVRGRRAAGYLARPWAIAQELPYGDPAAFNRALLADLARGQTAVTLTLDPPTRDGRDPDAQPGDTGRSGVSLATAGDVAEALRDVQLTAVPLFVHCGASALPLLALLVAHLRRAGQPVAALRGGLSADPLGVLAEDGALPLPLNRAYDEMAAVTRWAAGTAPGLTTVAVHAAAYHDAGGSAVHELAFALATGAAYLRALGERGVDIATAAPRIIFDFAVGGHFFMEIAKLRAARLLWAQAVAAFGGDDTAQGLRLSARTARRNKTAVDPYANMLRVTTEALAAAVGGVDSLHVAPFDEPLGLPDEFSRRIARNVQIILQEEAHVTQVIDPAGGSYAVEALTGELARAAWALFQEIERHGGMAAALENGFVQSSITAVAEKRAAALARRRDVLVGVNQFANPAEKPPVENVTDDDALHRQHAERLAAHRDSRDAAAVRDALSRLAAAAPDSLVEAAITAAETGATVGEITAALGAPTTTAADLTGLPNPVGPDEADGRPLTANTGWPASSGHRVTPLQKVRAAKPFEALREMSLDYVKSHGHPPRLFLANLGPARQHKARADFAQAFFEVGGFQVITNNGYKSPEDAAAAALASGAPAVVICSTDETYPDLVPPLVAALKAAAPDMVVVLAGRPADQVEALRAAGVDEFIYFGADMVALNRWLKVEIVDHH